MIIYPAIDLRKGQCVRLSQGDFNKETIYNNSPLDMAQCFIKQGAKHLHLVDLDGAKDSRTNQAQLIKQLLQTDLQIQVGGGLRTMAQIETYLEWGASAVVIGSLAIEEPQKVKDWLKKIGPDKLILAFDVKIDKEPLVLTKAWQNLSGKQLYEVIADYVDYGLQQILCTDISKDGLLKGPNFDLYQSLLFQFPKLKIQASGGIRHLDCLHRLKTLGLNGAIVGRALYEKNLDLKEALLC